MITPKECYALLDKYGIEGAVLEHTQKVEKIATYLGTKLKEKIESIDLNLIITGAILHDIGKRVADHTKMNHVEAGTIILKGEELHKHAEICRTHSIHAYYDDKEYPKTWEAKIVNYADKRVIESELVTLNDRLDYLKKRYFNKPEFSIIDTNIRKLEKEIFELIQIDPNLNELTKKDYEKSNSLSS